MISDEITEYSLLDALWDIDGKNEPDDGTHTFIHRRGSYLSGMPYEWTGFAERAFIFKDHSQAAALILAFPELAGSTIGHFNP